MKRALLLTTLLVSPALGADLPKAVPLKAAPVVAPYSGFYFFAGGGMGTAAQESIITQNGLNVSTAAGFNNLKAHPTGALVDAGIGVVAPTAIGKVGAEFDANFIFSQASQDCATGMGCFGRSRNAFLLQPKILYSPFPTPMAWTGWQWTKTLDAFVTAGVPLRELSACLSTSMTTEACDTAWLYGWSVGAIVEFPIYQQASLRLVYDHNSYAGSISHDGSGIFGPGGLNLQNNMKVVNEDLFKVQVKYSF